MSNVHRGDYVYAAVLDLASQFETFLKQQFYIRSFETERFRTIGVSLFQEESVAMTFDATEKLSSIDPIRLSDETRKEKDRIATTSKLSSYRSLIGNLLCMLVGWLGQSYHNNRLKSIPSVHHCHCSTSSP